MPDDGEAPPSLTDGLPMDSDPSEAVAPNHAAAEGAPEETTVGSSNVREMLFSTEPERSLDAIESPWDPERGGPRRVYRGLQKMADVDGMPAIFDVGLGIAETVVWAQQQSSESDAEDDSDQAEQSFDEDLSALAGAGGV
ncbi:hypothetical protein ELS19_01390 [Halogeometricum borinquense]|uniref:Uncharacterized protein n=1 Tax=Halogeometricum borinquense TaxID=60847 RepID=A0A482T522_9EURY|nr:hypothetical protein [Halogeometricum borinquense]RYJ12754.1 hypothetical protein ELS19_01390 [Halogeometricum borinquense]